VFDFIDFFRGVWKKRPRAKKLSNFFCRGAITRVKVRDSRFLGNDMFADGALLNQEGGK
jgi:hypothetical protein